MADLEQSLAAHLNAHLAGTTLYAGHIPQQAVYPFVAYFVLNVQPDYVLSGFSTYVTADINFHAWGRTHADTVALLASLRLAIEDVKAFGSFALTHCHRKDEFTVDPSPPDDGADMAYYHRVARYKVGYYQTLSGN